MVLAYAITCHKSQGQTLPSAIVHCSQEFVPGLTYVAASRVQSVSRLQLVRFNPAFLIVPPADVLAFDITCHGEVCADKSCCRNKELPEECFKVTPDAYISESGHVTDDDFIFPDDMFDGVVTSYFERENVNVVEDLGTVYGILKQHESQYAQPPESFDIDALLTSLFVETPLTHKQKEKNEVINQLKSNQDIHNILVPLLLDVSSSPS